MNFNQEELELIKWLLERSVNAGDISDDTQDDILKLLDKTRQTLKTSNKTDKTIK